MSDELPISSNIVFKLNVTDDQYAALFARDQQMADESPYPMTSWLQEITPAREVEVYQFAGFNTVEFAVPLGAMLGGNFPQVQIVDMINGYSAGMSLADIDALAQKTQHVSDRPAGCRWNQKVTQ